MNDETVCRQLRKEFSKNGWALLIYSLVMNVCVTAVCILDAVIQMVMSGGELDYFECLEQAVTSNGWGYALTVLIGLICCRIWKGKNFCRIEIWKKGRPMKATDFLGLLCVFMSGQAIFQVMSVALEMILNPFGMSILESMEAAAMTADSFSMFLYLTLLAPVTEEIFFRGVIQRSLEPYGKKFAILGSAFLFGIFHGNIVQSPYAFAVGLVLGYVASEYSIVWAMVLHMFNNLVMGDMLTRITEFVPGWVGEVLSFGFIWGFALLGVLVLVLKRKKIAAYFQNGKMHPWCVKSFFCSPGVIALTVYMTANILFTLIAQLFA